MQQLEQDKLRDMPGWEKNAPIPICMEGDFRALTFCCKPGYSLTFGYKCARDEVLAELGITPEEFVSIKEKFSKENEWDSEYVCFHSFSYCCMRRGGCSRRDPALMIKYPNMTYEQFITLYFRKKKELAKIILQSALSKNHIDPKTKNQVEFLLSLF